MKMINNNIPILYEDNHIIVVIKPEGVLSQADDTNDLDMLSIIKEYLKVTYNKIGNVYLGLVHRLDRRVSGVMVFSKTSKASSRLSEDIRNHNFEKKYVCICSGFLEGSNTLTNKLSKVDNKAVIDKNGKESILDYTVIDNFSIDNNIFSVCDINLHTGRFNQIRKQFSIINHPLINDFKYGYNLKNYNDHIGLFCVELSFNHPTLKTRMTFRNYLFDEIKKDFINYFKVM